MWQRFQNNILNIWGSLCAALFISMALGSGPAELYAKDRPGEVKDKKKKVLKLNRGSLKNLRRDVPVKGFRPVNGGLMLEDFSEATITTFPEDWMARKERGIQFYEVAKDPQAVGSQYLKAYVEKDVGSIFLRAEWDLKKYPILEWRWRAKILPEGGMEKKQRTNDSTLGLYIIFPLRMFIPDSLKYVWSTLLPVGEEFANGFGRNKIQVIRTGPSQIGKWVVERRNIYDEYYRRFKRKPPNPIAIGVITDADNTKSKSAGDYDYFKVLEGTTSFDPSTIRRHNPSSSQW